MMKQRTYSRARTLFGALVLCSGLAQAGVLYTDSISILNTDPTQLGRLSRNGIIADWSFQEPFPGVINVNTTYHYRTVTVQVPNWLSFLQISIDSESANIFASVYDTSYNPDPLAANRGLDVNYMGDAGASGNIFGNPRFFQVIDETAANSPSGFGTVVLVLNETSANGGLNSPVGVVVEGFSDTGFNEVPEPLTGTLLGGGLFTLAVLRRRHACREN